MVDRVRALEGEPAPQHDGHESSLDDPRRTDRFRTMMEEAPLGIVSVAGATGRHVFVNKAYATFLGRSEEELMNSDAYDVWREVTHPDDFERDRLAVERLATGEVDRYQLEKRLIHISGEARWVRSDVVVTRDDNGRLEYVTAYFTDIQAQRTADIARERLEAQVRQSQKLEALGKLAGGVAHDFNNRLVIILGYTEFLKRGLPNDSPLVDHADAVLASAQRAAELTRQLLAYCRRQVLKPETFDLNHSVEGMRRLLERLIGDSIELSTTLGAKHSIFSDRGQIEQVILNLAINARDAMPQGGRLTLETMDVALRADEDPLLVPGDYVALVVRDSGTGIPSEVLPHIFEPFFSTKDVGDGTGLGLSMVEGIVRQSGGVVNVTTHVGDGTTFRVLLPRGREAATEVRPSADLAPPRDLNFETVLVCEDDEGIRELLVDVLRLRAYRVLSARNGKHALEVAREHGGPIHLLVTDVVMPELGGTELAAELQKTHPGLLVLYVSGYSESADFLSNALGPTTRFLAKPFLPGDLTRAVFSMLEEGPRRDATSATNGASTD